MRAGKDGDAESAPKKARERKKIKKRKYKFLNEKRDEGDILPRRKKASGKRK